jgi:hypothetical protein
MGDKKEINKTKIKVVPKSTKEIGLDTKGEFYDNIVNAGLHNSLDISQIESFSSITNSRENVYKALDEMCADSTVSSIIEAYTEDVTEPNENNQIVWAESTDSLISEHINYLLDKANVDKHIYGWTNGLIRYGDVYLRLYRESDEEKYKIKGKASDILNEKVILNVKKKNDPYTGYVEMVKNPAQVFELTKLGKTQGYIKSLNNPADTNNTSSVDNIYNNLWNYQFNQQDVEIYSADAFVHGYLEDTSSRTDEKVNIFIEDEKQLNKNDETTKYDTQLDTSTDGYSFSVRRGKALLYDTYKIWKQVQLTKLSMILNRITKSSIVRIAQVEVGTMSPTQVRSHLQGVKSMIEQKASVSANLGMSEYTNPGPMENTIYLPTKDGIGAVQLESLGGDATSGQLDDIDKLEDDLFGSARVPKQYFGKTSDGAGFDGGESLAQYSSRYAKAIKRIQSSLTTMITTLINLYLIDEGKEDYIGQFTIKMQQPTTKEDVNRVENQASRISLVRDTMDILSEIENPTTRLKITSSLLSKVLLNEDAMSLIQDEIDKMEKQEEENEENEFIEEENDFDLGSLNRDDDMESIPHSRTIGSSRPDLTGEEEMNMPNERPSEIGNGEEMSLPTPNEVPEMNEPEENFTNKENKEILVEDDPKDDMLPNMSDLDIDFTISDSKE